MTQKTTVYICGSGHSGSTLLDMLLGKNSQVAALGEVCNLTYYLTHRGPGIVCACGQHASECPFWQKVEMTARRVLNCKTDALSNLPLMDVRHYYPRSEDGQWIKPPAASRPRPSRVNQIVLTLGSKFVRRALAVAFGEVRKHQQLCRNINTLYEIVREAHQVPVVVDATKSPGFFKGIRMEATTPVHAVVVLRDGRAVCASRMRREGVSMEHAASIWRSEHQKRRLVQGPFPRRMTYLRYEELCQDLEATLEHLCHDIGIEFEPKMLDFRGDAHNLGGNPMRHRKSEKTIRLDERWRSQLTTKDLDAFDRVAGNLNQSLGYAA